MNKLSSQAEQELFAVLLRHNIELDTETRIALVQPLCTHLYIHHPDISAPMRTATEILGFTSYKSYHIEKKRLARVAKKTETISTIVDI